MLKSHRPLLVAMLAFLLLMSLNGAGGASGQVERPARSDKSFRPGVVLVKFKPGVGTSERRAAVAAAEGVEETRIAAIGVRRIAVPQGHEMEKVAELRANPLVAYAEPDYVASAVWTPNDPAYQAGYQWGLQKIDASAAWDRNQGSGVTVAVIDTGVDLNHPDLAANIVAGYNFVAQNNTPMDDNGHGTHVSGIIAAVGNNGVGVIGVAPQAKIMPLKALDSSGSGYYSDIEQAITYAADHGAKVINMSLGGQTDDQSLHDAVDYAWSKGAVIVAAAGNDGANELFYPAAYSNVMAVAATDSTDAKAWFSNYGSFIDVAAPGDTIYSTYYSATDGSTYAYLSGTSMATPFVAGTAALVFSDGACQGVTNSAVRQAIENGADSIDAINPSYVGLLGHGRINALRSLPTPPPLTVSASNLYFLVAKSDQQPQSQTVTVGTGSCGDPWSASVAGSASQSGWLTLADSNTAPDNLIVTANPTGLATGTYTATLAVGYVDAGGSSQETISVGLKVVDQVYTATLPSTLKQSP